VIEAHCQYQRAARYDDELEIRAEGRLLSGVRMEFTYELVQKGESAISASGRTVHVAVDPTGRPCRLPERIRQAFA
jgi:acyl-CoA thioester hydrolase